MTVENMTFGTLETFKEICNQFVMDADCIDASYDIMPDNRIDSLTLRIGTDFQMIFKCSTGKMSVYVENQINGQYAEMIICDGAVCDTRLYMSKYINFKELEKSGYNLDAIDKQFKPVKLETITQSVARIEENIYNIDYDALSEYLKGIRDFMNLLNGTENNKEIADYILAELNEYNNDSEIPF